MSDVTNLFPRATPRGVDEAFVVAKRRLHEALIELEELHLWWRESDLDGYDSHSRLEFLEEGLEQALRDLKCALPDDYEEPPPDSGVRATG